MTEIVIFHHSNLFDFDDDPAYTSTTSKIFDEKIVQVSDNDLNWLQKTREQDGWRFYNLQAVLKEMFDRA
jgi:hypothetical protein